MLLGWSEVVYLSMPSPHEMLAATKDGNLNLLRSTACRKCVATRKEAVPLSWVFSSIGLDPAAEKTQDRLMRILSGIGLKPRFYSTKVLGGLLARELVTMGLSQELCELTAMEQRIKG